MARMSEGYKRNGENVGGLKILLQVGCRHENK